MFENLHFVVETCSKKKFFQSHFLNEMNNETILKNKKKEKLYIAWGIDLTLIPSVLLLVFC